MILEEDILKGVQPRYDFMERTAERLQQNLRNIIRLRIEEKGEKLVFSYFPMDCFYSIN